MNKPHDPAATRELIQAYHAANIDAVPALLARGAHIDARLETGKTLLQAAITQRQEAFAFTLLGYGASTAALSEDDGLSALHYAVRDNYVGMIDALLAAGADPNIRSRSGMTPLHIAAEETNIRNIKALIKAGADVCAEDNNGRTPRRLAEVRAQESFAFAAQEYGQTADFLKPLEDKRREELERIRLGAEEHERAQRAQEDLFRRHDSALFRLKPPRK